MGKRPIPRGQALHVAQQIIEKLSPACMRIEIAGSLRRGNANVGDIEIAAIPALESSGLFGKPASKLDRLIRDLRSADQEDGGYFMLKDGPRYKKLSTKVSGDEIGIDLFLADADNWGYIFAIRTGPAGYSKHVVTQRCRGGALDDDHRTKDGYVWRSANSFGVADDLPSDRTMKIDGLDYVMVPTPEESDFFNLITGGYVEPNKRRYQ